MNASLDPEPAFPATARGTCRRTGIPLLSLLFLLVPARGLAQAAGARIELLPDRGVFAAPLADPLEPRMAAGLLTTNLLRAAGPERPPWNGPRDRELQAAVAIGGTIPVLRLVDRPEGGVVVGAQAGVLARFRIERSSRDDLAQDWFVGMPVEAAWNRFSARARIVHRSAHLGDEFSVTSGARRIEFGGETLDLLTAWRTGAVRFYGGGGWIVHSNTEDTDILVALNRADRFSLQAGFDASWRTDPDHGLGFVAGLDWQTAERTGWRPATAATAGIEFRRDERFARLLVRAFDGTSPMGQFFLTNERYGSLEFELGF